MFFIPGFRVYFRARRSFWALPRVKMVKLLRIYLKEGVAINLVRLGFSWLSSCCSFLSFTRRAFIEVLVSYVHCYDFGYFCRQLFWFMHFFSPFMLQPLYGWRRAPCLLLYSGRIRHFRRRRRKGIAITPHGVNFSNRKITSRGDQSLLSTSFFNLSYSHVAFGSFRSRSSVCGRSHLFFRSRFPLVMFTRRSTRAVWPVNSRMFWFRTRQWLRRRRKALRKKRTLSRKLRRRRKRWVKGLFRGRCLYINKFRERKRGLMRIVPGPVIRNYRFIRKFRAFFTVRALHTNLFFTIRQGNTYFLASTGMFDDLKHGTKRKRTLLAGWFLADRLFERASPFLKEKTIFRVDLYGRTSGRRGIWFSWRTKPWRLYIIRSRTPLAFNGTRGCRRRRL